ncbi:hypothetical protein chiPu_0029681 [Chiloscyllium punctatum]|uniref:Uncharacterized protein n=1 Tax=Chiloscyllium punctatum TaxID=137246 RepID=A0A401TSU0_CHIPU|nr:hypothetical protein [Chiloscyllium punctatum]
MVILVRADRKLCTDNATCQFHPAGERQSWGCMGRWQQGREDCREDRGVRLLQYAQAKQQLAWSEDSELREIPVHSVK